MISALMATSSDKSVALPKTKETVYKIENPYTKQVFKTTVHPDTIDPDMLETMFRADEKDYNRNLEDVGQKKLAAQRAANAQAKQSQKTKLMMAARIGIAKAGGAGTSGTPALEDRPTPVQDLLLGNTGPQQEFFQPLLQKIQQVAQQAEPIINDAYPVRKWATQIPGIAGQLIQGATNPVNLAAGPVQILANPAQAADEQFYDAFNRDLPIEKRVPAMVNIAGLIAGSVLHAKVGDVTVSQGIKDAATVFRNKPSLRSAKALDDAMFAARQTAAPVKGIPDPLGPAPTLDVPGKQGPQPAKFGTAEGAPVAGRRMPTRAIPVGTELDAATEKLLARAEAIRARNEAHAAMARRADSQKPTLALPGRPPEATPTKTIPNAQYNMTPVDKAPKPAPVETSPNILTKPAETPAPKAEAPAAAAKASWSRVSKIKDASQLANEMLADVNRANLTSALNKYVTDIIEKDVRNSSIQKAQAYAEEFYKTLLPSVTEQSKNFQNNATPKIGDAVLPEPFLDLRSKARLMAQQMGLDSNKSAQSFAYEVGRDTARKGGKISDAYNNSWGVIAEHLVRSHEKKLTLNAKDIKASVNEGFAAGKIDAEAFADERKSSAVTNVSGKALRGKEVAGASNSTPALKTGLDAAYEQAVTRRKSGGTGNSNRQRGATENPAQVLADYTVIAAYHIRNGARTAREVLTKMLAEHPYDADLIRSNFAQIVSDAKGMVPEKPYRLKPDGSVVGPKRRINETKVQAGNEVPAATKTVPASGDNLAGATVLVENPGATKGTPRLMPGTEPVNWLDRAVEQSKKQRDNYDKANAKAKEVAETAVLNATERVSKKGLPVTEVEFNGQIYRAKTLEELKTKISKDILDASNPRLDVPLDKSGFGALIEILRRRGWKVGDVETSSKSESQYLRAFPPGRTPEEGPVSFRMSGHDNYSDPTLNTAHIEVGSGKVDRNGVLRKSTYRKLGNRADVSDVAIHDLDEVVQTFETNISQPSQTMPVTAESVGVKSSTPKGTPNEKIQEPIREVQDGQGNVQGKQPQGQSQGQKANAELPQKEEVKYAASNAASNDIRAGLGIDALPEAGKRHWDQVLNTATKSYDGDKIDARIKDTKKPLNDVETAQVALRSAELSNKLKTVSGEEYDALEKKLLEHTIAARDAGTEQGRALAARNMAVLNDYSQAGMYRRYAGASKVKTADEIPTEVTEKIRQLSAERDTHAAEVERLRAELNKQTAKVAEQVFKQEPKTPRTRTTTDSKLKQEALRKRIQQSMSRTVGSAPVQFLFDSADDIKALAKLKIADGAKSLDEVRSAVVSELKGLGADIDPEQFDAVMAGEFKSSPQVKRELSQYQQVLKEAKAARASSDAGRIAKAEARLKNLEENLQGRIDRVGKKSTVGRQLLDAEVKMKAREIEFDSIVENARQAKAYEEKSKAGKIAHNIFGAARGLVLGADASSVGNQGIFQAIAHPVSAAKSVASGVRAMTSHEAMIRELAKVKASPLYERAVASKLDLSAVHGRTGSEFFSSDFVNKLPVYKQAEHLFNVQLASQRMRAFEGYVKSYQRLAKYTKGGALTDADYNAIAEMVNTSTGVGTGKVAAGAKQLSNAAGGALLAPGYRVSRLKLALGTPVWNAVRVRNYHLASLLLSDYLKVAGGITALAYAAKQAGADVETDPIATDFLKMRIGGTSVDMSGGLASPVKAVSQWMVGSRAARKQNEAPKSVSGQRSNPESLMQWLVSSMSPHMQIAFEGAHQSAVRGYNAATNTTKKPEFKSYGKNVDLTQLEGIGNFLMQLTPVSAQTTKEIMESKDLNEKQKSILAVASFLGLNVNVK